MELMDDKTEVTRLLRVDPLMPSQLQALCNIVLPADWEVVAIKKVSAKVSRVMLEYSKNSSSNEMKPEKTMSLFFTRDEMEPSSFHKFFAEYMKVGKYSKEDKPAEPWEILAKESENNIHFGISKPVRVEGARIYLFSKYPGLESITKAAKNIMEAMSHVSVESFESESENLKPTWIGPGVSAGIFFLEALMLFFSSATVYHFGRTQSSGMPNKATAVVFLALGVLFLIRYIRIGYLFIFVTEGLTIAQLIISIVFPGKSFADSSLPAILITIMHIFLLVFIPVRPKDFNLFNFREFFRALIRGR